uniref:Uncharacterized protein n=1 Tax=Anopheles atroparvus TaxID=41427 RepID=A0A182IT43_ANOAO
MLNSIMTGLAHSQHQQDTNMVMLQHQQQLRDHHQQQLREHHHQQVAHAQAHQQVVQALAVGAGGQQPLPESMEIGASIIGGLVAGEGSAGGGTSIMSIPQPVQQPMDTSGPLLMPMVVSSAPLIMPMVVTSGNGIGESAPGTGNSIVVGGAEPTGRPGGITMVQMAMGALGASSAVDESLDESRSLPSELTTMTDTELMNYICPSAFDSV